MTTAKFKAVPVEISRQLLAFVNAKNVGKSINIDGKDYKLEHISCGKNAFWHSRGLSVYFRVGKSVIRISDHWAESVGNDKSGKLNCGSIDGKKWVLVEKSDRLSLDYRSGGFPWVMVAGICGVASLNKTCEHFK